MKRSTRKCESFHSAMSLLRCRSWAILIHGSNNVIALCAMFYFFMSGLVPTAEILFLCLSKEKVFKKKGHPTAPCFLALPAFSRGWRSRSELHRQLAPSMAQPYRADPRKSRQGKAGQTGPGNTGGGLTTMIGLIKNMKV